MGRVFTKEMAKKMYANMLKRQYLDDRYYFTIPNGFTEIEEGAFENTDISAIMFPQSLEIIGDRAFKNCTRIKEVQFPARLKRIGKSAFENCKKLCELTFEYKMIECIDDRAFYNCTSLPDDTTESEITIPESVMYIGRNAFARSEPFNENLHLALTLLPNEEITIDYCYSHEPINLSAYAVHLNDYDFSFFMNGAELRNNNDQNYYFTAYNAKELYANYILTRKDPYEKFIAKIPEGVVTICKRAFCDMPLDDVIFPDSLVVIGSESFSNTHLTDVTIPENVKCVDFLAFSKNQYLRSCTIKSKHLEDIDDCFESCPSLERITIPPKVKHLGYYAFSGCTSLKEIELNEDLEYIGYRCFENCRSLEKIVLPATIKYLINGWNLGVDYGRTGKEVEIVFKGHEDWKVPRGYYIQSYKDGKLNVQRCFSESEGYPAKIEYLSTGEIIDKIEELYNRAIRFESGERDRKFAEEMNVYWRITVYYKDKYVMSFPCGDHIEARGSMFFTIDENTEKELEYILAHREGILLSFIETILPNTDRRLIYCSDKEFDCEQDMRGDYIEESFFMRKYAGKLDELPRELISGEIICKER